MNNQKIKILCCDDDEGILDLLSLIITDLGYEAVTIREGSDIENIIDKVKPQMIFLDLWMPKVNGEVLGKKLKSNSKTKNIPLIIISAHKDTPKKAEDIHADEYVSKPFDVEVIEEVVGRYLI